MCVYVWLRQVPVTSIYGEHDRAPWQSWEVDMFSLCVSMWQVPVTFIYGEHDWMNPAAGVAVAEILDRIRERKVGACLVYAQKESTMTSVTSVTATSRSYSNHATELPIRSAAVPPKGPNSHGVANCTNIMPFYFMYVLVCYVVVCPARCRRTTRWSWCPTVDT
jgi:hypothetical protein